MIFIISSSTSCFVWFNTICIGSEPGWSDSDSQVLVPLASKKLKTNLGNRYVSFILKMIRIFLFTDVDGWEWRIRGMCGRRKRKVGVRSDYKLHDWYCLSAHKQLCGASDLKKEIGGDWLHGVRIWPWVGCPWESCHMGHFFACCGYPI